MSIAQKRASPSPVAFGWADTFSACKPSAMIAHRKNSRNGFDDFLEAPGVRPRRQSRLVGILKSNIWHAAPDGKSRSFFFLFVHLPPENQIPTACVSRGRHAVWRGPSGEASPSTGNPTKGKSSQTGSIWSGLPTGAFHGLDDIFIDHAGGMYLTERRIERAYNHATAPYRDPARHYSKASSRRPGFPTGGVSRMRKCCMSTTDGGTMEIIAVPVV